ncbi:hypothetical protein GGR57DRAFT_313799 [Xylariaceae sp. FL1272]|nr:hypothetical protein GGR57DRAFT_313799 [Xylariaceae sp. FL1272]
MHYVIFAFGYSRVNGAIFQGNPEIHRYNQAVLACLPAELRLMIYDLTMPPRHINFDMLDLSWSPPSGPLTLPPGNFFEFPIIAHTCKEMRQYAMRKYRFVWYRYQPIKYTAFPYATIPPIPQIYGVRAFNPRADTIAMHLYRAAWVKTSKSTIIKWDDPFHCPWAKKVRKSGRRIIYGTGPHLLSFTVDESGDIRQQVREGFRLQNPRRNIDLG